MKQPNPQHRTRGVPGYNKRIAVTHFKSSFLRCLLPIFLLLFGSNVYAQLSLTATNTAVVINFTDAVSGVNAANLASTSGSAFMAASPASGQLDADAWAIVGDGATSGAAATFPGSYNANFNTTTNASSNTGWGASNISSNREIAIFPSGSQATPGSLTLRIQNNTGSTLTSLDISYSVRAYNDQARSNKVEFWYSATNTASSYTEVTSAEFVSTAAASNSFESASPSFSITGLSIADGEFYYVRWFFDDVGGSGSRDEFFLDNISVTGQASSSPFVSAVTFANPFITTALNTNSTEQSFTVSGLNLTDDLTVNAPSNYQVSLTPGGPYTSSVAISNGGSVTNQPVYAVFNPSSLSQQGTSGNFVVTSTGANTVNVTATGEVTNLSAGALAFIAFQGSAPDIFRMVALQDIPEGTRLYLTDKSWDGSLGTPAFTAGEGFGLWTAPAGGVSRGTVIAFDADAGTASVGTGGLGSGLGSAGEQLFAYQGSLALPTFVAGFTSGATIASGTPLSTETWVPAGLTNGTNYIALANNAGASSLNVAANIRTLTDHRSFIHNTSNWTTATSASWPTWTFTFLANEPTSQPSFTAASNIGNNELTLNFSGGDGTSYIVVMREGAAVTAVPVDGTSYTAITSSANFTTAQEISPGQRIVYNGTNSNTDVEVTNLSPGTTYHYAIYAYNGTTSGDRENYLTSSPGTGSETTSGSANSNTSDIIAHASFIEPSNIAYDTYQENSNLTDLNSLEVARFTMRDGGASNNDGDANGTILNAITFGISNHSVLRRIALYNGSSELAEATVTGNSVTFSGLSLTASDDNNVDFSLRVSFLSSVTDNTQFSFTINSVTADIAGSNFAAVDAGGAVSSTTGDRNRIEVTATELAFIQQPSNVNINTAMTPAVTVEAIDALNNRDLDYITDMTVSATGATLSGTNTVTPTAGLGTFNNIQFSTAANGVTIGVSSGSLSNTGNSSTFNVNQGPTTLSVGDLTIIGMNLNAPDNFAFVCWVDLNDDTYIKFTDNGFLAASSANTTNNARGGENFVIWRNNTGNTITAGTVITIQDGTPATTNLGTIVSGTLSGLAAAGDQIFAYQGPATSGANPDFSSNSNPTTFNGTILFGINLQGSGSATNFITTGTASANTSYLPTELNVTGGNIAFGASASRAQYTGPRTTECSLEEYKSLVNDPTNWTTGSGAGTLTLNTDAFTFGTPAVPTTVGSYSKVANHTDGATITYTDACNIIAQVADQAGGNTLGSTTVSSELLSSNLISNNNGLVGQVYMVRNYAITPSSSGTATITFLVPQADFTAYNASNGSLLDMPTSGSNADPNIANIRLAKVTGGTLTTGTFTYPSISVNWNNTDSRWEISTTTDAEGLYYFFTDPACNTVISGLGGTPTANSVNLTWTAAPGATSYDVRYRAIGAATWQPGGSTTGTTITVNGLLPGTNYETQIKARCTPTTSGLFSTSFNFTTDAAPCGTAATVITPITVTNNSATITWNAVSGVSTYWVEFKQSAAINWSTWSTTSTSLVLTGLLPNTNYDVRIRNTCATGGAISAPSTTENFTTSTSDCITTPAAINTPITPGSTSATISWSAVSGTATYWVNFKPTSGSTWTTWSTSSTSMNLTNLIPGTQYDVRVMNQCTGGGFSAFSAVEQFTTTANPCITSPAVINTPITPGSTSATISWSAVSGTATYWVNFKPTSGSTWSTWSTSSTSINLTNLTPGTQYDVRIQNQCTGGGFSGFSTVEQFTTTANPCITTPADINTPITAANTSATISWSAVSGTATYWVFFKPSASSTWSTWSTTSTSINLTGLQPNTQYDVRMMNQCTGGGFSALGTMQQFTTTANTCISTPVTINTPITTTQNSATITWNSVAGVASYSVQFKTVAASTWSTPSTSNTSFILSNLLPGTTYQVRIMNICTGGGFSAFSATQEFTTASAKESSSIAASIFNFIGETKDNANVLTWSTISEENNSGFNVLNSTDGVRYEPIATISSKADNGSSDEMLHYSFVHESPSATTNYYRIESVAIDNTAMLYNRVVTLNNQSPITSISLYPNPTRDIVTIDMTATTEEALFVKVMDMTGRVVKVINTKTQKGQQLIPVSLNEYSSGIYTIQVMQGAQLLHVGKVQKQD